MCRLVQLHTCTKSAHRLWLCGLQVISVTVFWFFFNFTQALQEEGLYVSLPACFTKQPAHHPLRKADVPEKCKAVPLQECLN